MYNGQERQQNSWWKLNIFYFTVSQIALVQSAMSHLLVDILLYVVHDQDCCAERIYFKYLREPNTADKLEEKALMVASQLNILSTQMYR